MTNTAAPVRVLAGAMEFTPHEVLLVLTFIVVTVALLVTYLGFFLAGLIKAARAMPPGRRWIVCVPVALISTAIAATTWPAREAFALAGLAIGIPLIWRASRTFGTALALPLLVAIAANVRGIR